MSNEFSKLGLMSKSSERSKSDMEYCTKLNRWLLTPLGIWPLADDANIAERAISKVSILTCYLLLCSLFVSLSFHTLIYEEDSRIKIKMIGPLGYILVAIIKYYFLLTKKAKIGNCFEHIHKDWNRITIMKDREIMLVNAMMGRTIVFFCAAFMYSAGFLYYAIIPLSTGSFVTPDNITVRPLVYPVDEPFFFARATPTYEIVFTTQFFSGFVSHMITCGTSGLAAVFAMHACGQLKIVMSRLDSFVEGDKNLYPLLEDRMAEIVQIHLRALGKLQEFERAEAISTVTYCLLLVSVVFNIFIFCHIGEILTQQAKKVGTTAYMTNWYNLSGKNAKALILLIAISNYPYSITAGKMTDLSYNAFCGVIRTAMAYFNLLRSLIM